MSCLVIVEHDNHVMQSITRSVVTAALSLDSAVFLLVIGYQCRAVADEAAKISGINKVFLVDAPCYEHFLAENISAFIVSIAATYSVILAPATTYGKNFLPRVAALLDVAQLSDVTNIVDGNTFKRQMYAGNAIATVRLLDAQKVMTIRTTAFAPVVTKQEPCVIETLPPLATTTKTTYISQTRSESTRPSLNNAKIIVSGGRALQNCEKFKIIEELADVLGAAVGASRAAVDAGIVPNDYQIGQTGKIVAPTLYFAIGISGAVQHVAGMKDSKVIVAINNDANAAIFQTADYGLVGDLFILVPQLIQLLKK